MSVTLSPVGGAGAQFFDNNGNPLSGGKLYTYAAGTTTPVSTYTSAAGSTLHTNPIVLDSAGRVPGSSEIWLTDGVIYKFLLKTSVDVTLATWDNITGVNSNFVNFTAESEYQTATAGQTVFTLTTMTYSPGTGNLTVYVDGVNQYLGTSYVETDGVTVTFTAGLHVGALVKFTTAVETTGNATDASVVSYTPAGTGAVATTVQAKLRESVSVKDFGAVGDGVTDDTAAIQAALDSGYAVLFPQQFHGKITSALTATEAIYMEDDAYIQPTGSGYTAITITPQARSGPWRVVVGDGSTVFAGKGIVFGDPTAAGHTQITIDLLDARKCTSGGGVEINNLWESIVQKISAYGCGDASGYAVAIKSNVGDSTNTTLFNNITIGQSDTYAFYASAQFCTFPMVYIEQVTTPAAKFFWTKGCVKSNFGRIRIYNAGSADAWIGTCQSMYDFIDCSSNIVFDWTDSLGGEAVTIGMLSCDATISEIAPVGGPVQSRPITILSCDLATLNTGADNTENAGGKWNVSNGNITTLQVGRSDYAANPRSELAAEAVVFTNIDIGNFDIRDPEESSVSFENCRIRALGTTFNGYTRLLNCYVDANVTFTGDNVSALNYQAKVFSDGTFFGGTFNTVGNVTGQVINSTIVGNMTATNGGTTDIGIAFVNSGCNGTVAAKFGNPPALAESDGGVNWGKGKRIDNIAAAVGSPKGWICTVSGNPGTWVSEGNL